MTNPPFKLKNAPIIEAILDLECDMPRGYSIDSAEKLLAPLFQADYPKSRRRYEQQFTVSTDGTSTPVASQALEAVQFLQQGERQLVQARTTGFSFNRLAPYGSLDDYLPEIKRTWSLFAGATKPVQMKKIRLRYINRLMLPSLDGGRNVKLGDYLKLAPRVPTANRLILTGFLHQSSLAELSTGYTGNTVLTGQPFENEKLPVIFDIAVEAECNKEPGDWESFLKKINSLRDLKNAIFKDNLTEQCLALFQQ